MNMNLDEILLGRKVALEMTPRRKKLRAVYWNVNPWTDTLCFWIRSPKKGFFLSRARELAAQLSVVNLHRRSGG